MLLKITADSWREFHHGQFIEPHLQVTEADATAALAEGAAVEVEVQPMRIKMQSNHARFMTGDVVNVPQQIPYSLAMQFLTPDSRGRTFAEKL